MKKIIYLFITIFLSSCYTTPHYGNILNNCHTSSDLRYQIGPPTTITSNGAYGEIWTYEENYTQERPGTIYRSGPITTYSNPSTVSYTKYMKFYINAEGKIYNWETNQKTKESNDVVVFLLTFAITFSALMIIMP